MNSHALDDIAARLERVEERVGELPTVKREEDAAVHAHAAFALLRSLVLSLPAAEARKVCDGAQSFVGKNPGGVFPQYLKHAIADIVLGIAEEIRA